MLSILLFYFFSRALIVLSQSPDFIIDVRSTTFKYCHGAFLMLIADQNNVTDSSNTAHAQSADFIKSVCHIRCSDMT